MIQRVLFLSPLIFNLIMVTPLMANPLEQILTSSENNIHIDSWETSTRLATPLCPVNWSVRKMVLHGGKQEGVDVIVVDNGRLQLAVCPTRGMGLLWVKMDDVRLGWNSPVKETVHPQYINLASRGGLGWLEGFNEFMCRCGMEWSGHPGTDKFINNVGDEATMDLTLHGRVANLPASEVMVVVDRVAPFRIHIRGRVDERMFYGPKLELWAELSTEPGSNAFRISDTVSNRGDADQEFQLLYHTNFGAPLLENGSTFKAAIAEITPFNAHAAEGISTFDRYAGPTKGFIEQVYKIRPAADATGKSMAMLQNAQGDRAASVSFNVNQLPYLTQWKNTNAQREGYVTGIEPGTGFPYNRRIERAQGRVPKLAPGASHSVEIDYAIHIGKEAVEAAAKQIASIQGDIKAKVNTVSEKLE